MKLELIVALIGFLGLSIVPLITRIVKISKFRQAWIRNLRKSVSEFNKYLYRHSVLEEQRQNHNNDKKITAQYHENRSELYRTATLIITHLKIQDNNSIKEDRNTKKAKAQETTQDSDKSIGVNSNTKDNNEFDKNNYDKDELELIQAIKKAISNKDIKTEKDNSVEDIINDINTATQKVLKKTWEQVKEGEKSLKIYSFIVDLGLIIVIFFILQAQSCLMLSFGFICIAIVLLIVKYKSDIWINKFKKVNIKSLITKICVPRKKH